MNVNIGHAARPFNNNPPCGDGWLCLQQESRIRVMLADGIGHGRHAHGIAALLERQLRWICERNQRPVSALHCLEQLHTMLLEQGHDWQAAVAIADIDIQKNQIECVAVGNIEMYYLQGNTGICLASTNGMIGGRFPGRPQRHCWRAETNSILALFSDGMDSHSAREALQAVHNTTRTDVSDIKDKAEKLLRDCGRLTDDASCALVDMSLA